MMIATIIFIVIKIFTDINVFIITVTKKPISREILPSNLPPLIDKVSQKIDIDFDIDIDIDLQFLRHLHLLARQFLSRIYNHPGLNNNYT